MITEELISKAESVKKCGDLLEIVKQILIYAPDKETAIKAIDEVAEAIKTE